MRRILVVVQYDGTDYCGFQRQPELPTIQREIEQALTRLLGGPTTIIGAGRTDAGVHALGQTLTFDTDNPIPAKRVVTALNGLLPDAISAIQALEVPGEFHARYHAAGKLYGYRILNRELPSPFMVRYSWHLPAELDVGAMQQAAEGLLGEHDFVAFSSSGSSVRDTVMTLRRLDVQREGELVEFRAEANGFLYMMVRRLVGALVDVGCGRLGVEDVEAIRESRDRCRVITVAPPQGLSLIKVIY